MSARTVIRGLVAVSCLAATALGLNNTYGDDSEARALAEKAACGSITCSVKLLHESRSAVKASFGYQTELVEKGKSGRSASVDVECERAFFLFGDYHCRRVSGGIPGTPSATPP